jgi:PAS domain S-box-containing protein
VRTVSRAVDLQQRAEIEQGWKRAHNFSKSPKGKNSEPLRTVGELERTGESHLKLENMFRDLVERLPVGVFLNKDGKFIYVNKKFAKIGGWTVDEIVGKKYARDLVHPEDMPRLEQHVKNQLLGKLVPQVVAFRGITKTTQIVYLESHDCHFTTSGDHSVMIGTLVDVTERKRTEEELKKYRDHLQELVEERTRQLAKVNEELRRDVEKREQVEMALEIKSRDLEEANIALKVLLKQREDEKKELEEKISSNVKELILRYIGMLRETGLEPNQSLLIDIIDRNLNDFLSPFCRRITSFDFTSKEMEVILLTREGKTAKQMAQLFNITTDAISRHRYHIRKKLGLNKRRHNLRSYLLSLC